MGARFEHTAGPDTVRRHSNAPLPSRRRAHCAAAAAAAARALAPTRISTHLAALIQTVADSLPIGYSLAIRRKKGRRQ